MQVVGVLRDCRWWEGCRRVWVVVFAKERVGKEPHPACFPVIPHAAPPRARRHEHFIVAYPRVEWASLRALTSLRRLTVAHLAGGYGRGAGCMRSATAALLPAVCRRSTHPLGLVPPSPFDPFVYDPPHPPPAYTFFAAPEVTWSDEASTAHEADLLVAALSEVRAVELSGGGARQRAWGLCNCCRPRGWPQAAAAPPCLIAEVAWGGEHELQWRRVLKRGAAEVPVPAVFSNIWRHPCWRRCDEPHARAHRRASCLPSPRLQPAAAVHAGCRSAGCRAMK